ncbi:MAG: geranylgeranylglyceryl/heptaprenylglyceryl phosphate synthase [Flavobacteriaceae bacterium]
MHHIYYNIIQAKASNTKLLAVLLDPDKLIVDTVKHLVSKINSSIATHIFVGGSIVANQQTELIVNTIKQHTSLPIILFPGNVNQITNAADGMLFLSLLSGRNPEYLIEQHIKAVPLLHNTNLELIPTGYILIDGGTETAVQRVSNTLPISQNDITLAVNTALAGQFSGKKIIYLEAGSGAKNAINTELISAVSKALDIPLIVGGGLRSSSQINNAYTAGADMVVVGTAFEKNDGFLEKIH